MTLLEEATTKGLAEVALEPACSCVAAAPAAAAAAAAAAEASRRT